MDQLKEQLAVVAKYGFWIGCVVVIAASAWFWYSASSALDAENAKKTAEITAAFGKVSGIQAKLSTHPNDLSHQRMEEQIEVAEKEVIRAWSILYDRQKDILVWPVEELKEDFVKEFRGKVPIEKEFDFPTPEAEEVESTLRQRYARYIANSLPKIAASGGTEWKAKMNASYGRDSGSNNRRYTGNDVALDGSSGGPLVTWSASNQNSLLSELFPWQSGGRVPTTLEIYYSQENLWILQQLMDLIAQVNGAARQPYQAKIREINRLSIGSSVNLLQAGNILDPGMAGGGGMGEMGGGMGMNASAMAAMMSGMGGMGGMGGYSRSRQVGPDPADNRYVDETLESISGSTLRKAITSNQPENVAIALAKRVPVMMSLKMNQRAIPELLSACGSAKLMVEVSQVRILPKDAKTGGGGGGDPGGTDEAAMSMAMSMGDGRGASGAPPGVATKPVDEFPLDMTVEIFGIIYIYNPAEREKLGMEAVTEETVDEVVAKVEGKVTDEEPIDAESSINQPLPQPGATAGDAATPAEPGDAAPANPIDPASPPAAAPDAGAAAPDAGAAAPDAGGAAPDAGGVAPGPDATNPGAPIADPPAAQPVAPEGSEGPPAGTPVTGLDPATPPAIAN